MSTIGTNTTINTRRMFGRRVIYTDETVINEANILRVLADAYATHSINSNEISYLYEYWKGRQEILSKTKAVRPEINNMIVENHAQEIVTFKTGYLIGEPVQYTISGDESDITEVNKLNKFMKYDDKPEKDNEIVEWGHICGTAYRMILPNTDGKSPFNVYTLDPRNTFVIYSNSLGTPPIMAVTYTIRDRDQTPMFSIYTKDQFFSVEGTNGLVAAQPNALHRIPIIEYPLNNARLGAFEIVLPILDAINQAQSDRLDNVDQTVQSILLMHNTKIDGDAFDDLKAKGCFMFRDADSTLKGDVKYISPELSQTETQTLKDDLYTQMLIICGMPNRNGGSSTSDTGAAVIMRDGWSAAEAYAKNTELMFKRSEKEFLKIALHICGIKADMKITVSDIDIKFTRRNYENITQKANVLIGMLGSDKIAPELAFQSCGMFVDSESAYSQSKKYAEEQEAKNESKDGNVSASASENGGNTQ